MADLKLKERDGIWFAVGTIADRDIDENLGTTSRKVAKEIRAQIEARIWKAHIYGEEAVRTFTDAAMSYLAQGGEKRFVDPLIGYFGTRLISSIKPAEIRTMAQVVYPRCCAATRNRQAIAMTRAIINHAHELGWCAPIRVRGFATQKSTMHEPVDREWINAFLTRCDLDNLPHLAAMALFMNVTAARISEAINLTGEFVDLDERTAMLAKTKTEEWSLRHMTIELTERIRLLEPAPGVRIFRYNCPKAVTDRITAVCRRAGIVRRTSHSLGRHSFATNAMNMGVGIKTAMDAGGWKSSKLFMETYVHSKDASRSLAQMLDALR